MKKIAIINQRYGKEVNGGSETYTMQLAEHLKAFFDVEILTTCALDYADWKNYFPAGVEEDQGIRIRRFPVRGRRRPLLMKLTGRLMKLPGWNRKCWNHLWIRAQGPCVPELLSYLETHQETYDVFIFVTYLYYPAVYGLQKVGERSIFVPTAHEEPYIHFHLMKEVFAAPAAFVFLTEEEKDLVQTLFPMGERPYRVAAMGIRAAETLGQRNLKGKIEALGQSSLGSEENILGQDSCERETGSVEEKTREQIVGKPETEAGIQNSLESGLEAGPGMRIEQFRQKYGISGSYFIYAGRIDMDKGCGELIEYFEQYRAAHPEEEMALILIGSKAMEIPETDGVRYLGFLPEEDKNAGIAGARALILPSRHESLSISALEAMGMGVPVLVNGHCAVLEGHCRRSGAGLAYYEREGFCHAAEQLQEEAVCRQMGAAGIRYVREQYSWERVMDQWKELIAEVTECTAVTEGKKRL